MMKGIPSKLRQILKNCRHAFVFVGIFSFLVNILMLIVPLYMLQLFDRVIPSQSKDTLLYLSILALSGLIVFGLLDVARSRILVRVSHWLDNKLSPLALSQGIDDLLAGGNYAPESLRDISTLRQFIGGPSMFVLFDAPWTPLYLLVIYLLHPMLGNLATIGAIILFLLALLNEFSTKEPLKGANLRHLKNQQHIEKVIQNAEVIQAMGMLPNVISHWFKSNERVLKLQALASDRAALLLSLSKFSRLALQIILLGVGAYFVIQNKMTPGTMIAASIITARALAPMEQAINTWKQWKSTRYAYHRLEHFLEQKNLRTNNISLPTPNGELSIENVFYIPPHEKNPILSNVNFQVKAGETLVMIGPSGAGKSTLARLMLGIWKPTHGAIRLDGADVYDWERTSFGNEIGYLPQDVDLLPGTIRDNIARMKKCSDEEVISAAKLAGVHEFILRLPKGYQHIVDGFYLSGGQRQRIALARAFFGTPRVIILDEPNASLDNEGDIALDQAIASAKKNGVTMILISHRKNLVKHADRILVLNEGKLVMLGPRDDVLFKLQEQQPPTTAKYNETVRQ